MHCPECKKNWSDEFSLCPICGTDLKSGTLEEIESWIEIGYVEDKISADFAKEILDSYNIMAVIFSKSGFFGQSGLPLHPFYSNKSAYFDVYVPLTQKEEAIELLTNTIGDEKWHRKDND